MGFLIRAIGATVRLVLFALLFAVLILVGLTYFDRDQEVLPKVRGAVGSVVTPAVVESVERHGGDAASGLVDILGTVIREIDTAIQGSRDEGNGVAPAGTRVARAALDATESREVIDTINEYRRSKGLRPMDWDARLADFAQRRADDMIGRGYFSHHDPESGEVLLGDLRAWVTAGENLYEISGPTVSLLRDLNEQVVQGWRQSPSHNALLLDRRMDLAGVAIARSRTRVVAVLIATQ